MVPGMSSLIVRRSGQNPVVTGDLPVRLSLQPGSVAGCAMLGIKRASVLLIGGPAGEPYRSGSQASDDQDDQPPCQQTTRMGTSCSHAGQIAAVHAKVKISRLASLDLPALEAPILSGMTRAKEGLMRFHIPNMSCGGCARSVTRAIESVDADARIAIDLGNRLVEVSSDLPPPTFEAALAVAGYPVVPAAG